jgi:hypothetical protein
MKQPNHLSGLRVDARDVWALVKIAARAGETQVRWILMAAVLPGDDVLDVKLREGLVLVRKPTVFARIPCPLLNESPSRGIHHFSVSFFSRARAFDCKTEMNLTNRAMVS